MESEIKRISYSKISADELLARMRGIKLHASVSAAVCKQWQPYQELIRESAQHRSARKFGASIVYSKRAVCMALDQLVYACHLEKYSKKNYIQKIQIFENVGIEIPLVIHDLIINIRNRDEHEYTQSSETEARFAFEVATLFLGWLEHLHKIQHKHAVVFAGDYEGMVLFQKMVYYDEKEGMVFKGTPKNDYLFFDESEDRSQVKLINPSGCRGWYLYKDELVLDHLRQIREILAIKYPKEFPSSHYCSTGQFDLKQVSIFIREKSLI